VDRGSGQARPRSAHDPRRSARCRRAHDASPWPHRAARPDLFRLGLGRLPKRDRENVVRCTRGRVCEHGICRVSSWRRGRVKSTLRAVERVRAGSRLSGSARLRGALHGPYSSVCTTRHFQFSGCTPHNAQIAYKLEGHEIIRVSKESRAAYVGRVFGMAQGVGSSERVRGVCCPRRRQWRRAGLRCFRSSRWCRRMARRQATHNRSGFLLDPFRLGTRSGTASTGEEPAEASDPPRPAIRARGDLRARHVDVRAHGVPVRFDSHAVDRREDRTPPSPLRRHGKAGT